jgi:hypothetical protein
MSKLVKCAVTGAENLIFKNSLSIKRMVLPRFKNSFKKPFVSF